MPPIGNTRHLSLWQKPMTPLKINDRFDRGAFLDTVSFV